jgi:hypothetical protein
MEPKGAGVEVESSILDSRTASHSAVGVKEGLGFLSRA